MVSKYWLPTGTCHSISGNEVSVCMRLMNASQRVKFGNTTLLRSHQWTLDAAPYHAASWSATSLKITSHGVMPEGLPTSPALLMKAMTLSASAAGSTVERWSVAMSTLLAQLQECQAHPRDGVRQPGQVRVARARDHRRQHRGVGVLLLHESPEVGLDVNYDLCSRSADLLHQDREVGPVGLHRADGR